MAGFRGRRAPFTATGRGLPNKENKIRKSEILRDQQDVTPEIIGRLGGVLVHDVARSAFDATENAGDQLATALRKVECLANARCVADGNGFAVGQNFYAAGKSASHCEMPVEPNRRASIFHCHALAVAQVVLSVTCDKEKVVTAF